jgi:hypothetical protein
MTRRLVALAILGSLAIATASFASPTAGPSVRWSAKLTAPGHNPKARKRWPVKIVVKTAGGKAVSGTVQYNFLFNGTVVQVRSCLDHGNTPCKFKGTYRDVLHFPRKSIGYALTLRFIVKTRFGTKNIDYAIKVVK